MAVITILTQYSGLAQWGCVLIGQYVITLSCVLTVVMFRRLYQWKMTHGCFSVVAPEPPPPLYRSLPGESMVCNPTLPEASPLLIITAFCFNTVCEINMVSLDRHILIQALSHCLFPSITHSHCVPLDFPGCSQRSTFLGTRDF